VSYEADFYIIAMLSSPANLKLSAGRQAKLVNFFIAITITY